MYKETQGRPAGEMTDDRWGIQTNEWWAKKVQSAVELRERRSQLSFWWSKWTTLLLVAIS